MMLNNKKKSDLTKAELDSIQLIEQAYEQRNTLNNPDNKDLKNSLHKIIKKILIKLEKGIIKVKHSDLDDKFRSLNSLFKNIILSADETYIIYKASQELTLKQSFPNQSEMFEKIFN